MSKGARTPISEVSKKLENNTVIGKGSRWPNPEKLSIKTFGAHFAQVEVDTLTGEIVVEKIVAVHDIGRIVNPMTAANQVEGGVIQALGFALCEERVVDDALGRVMNADLEWYKIPTVDGRPRDRREVHGSARPAREQHGREGARRAADHPDRGRRRERGRERHRGVLRHVPMTPARVLEALAVVR